MKSPIAAFLAASIVFLSACSASDEPEKGPVVLAAASLQESLEAAADEWTAKGHPHPVLSFAGTSALARQVESGAPGDIFISADTKWMDELEEKGFLRPDSKVDFLTNSLVLIAPKGSDFQITVRPELDFAARLAAGRLAMADPEAVPAGRYGKQALTSLGQWDAAAPHIASAENVRAALALVSRKEAPLGIVYATDAKADDGVTVVGEFPAGSHAPITYPIALLRGSTSADAKAFRAFLLSEEGRAIFRQYGFGAD